MIQSVGLPVPQSVEGSCDAVIWVVSASDHGASVALFVKKSNVDKVERVVVSNHDVVWGLTLAWRVMSRKKRSARTRVSRKRVFWKTLSRLEIICTSKEDHSEIWEECRLKESTIDPWTSMQCNGLKFFDGKELESLSKEGLNLSDEYEEERLEEPKCCGLGRLLLQGCVETHESTKNGSPDAVWFGMFLCDVSSLLCKMIKRGQDLEEILVNVKFCTYSCAFSSHLL